MSSELITTFTLHAQRLAQNRRGLARKQTKRSQACLAEEAQREDTLAGLRHAREQ